MVFLAYFIHLLTLFTAQNALVRKLKYVKLNYLSELFLTHDRLLLYPNSTNEKRTHYTKPLSYFQELK